MITMATVAVILMALLASCGSSSSTTQTIVNNDGAQTSPNESAASAPAPDAIADPTPTQTPASPSSAPDVDDASSESAPAPEPTPTTEIPVFVPPTGIEPVRVEIPAIDVDAPTIDLNLAGPEPEVPVDFDDTGWYVQTRLPGEIGPAVIAGHIDSKSGPAVFARLDELVPGDEIIVYDDQDMSRTFVVVDANLYPKGDLPDGVFGFGDPEPELRLITCGGSFDETTGHYRDNYVVFAHLAPDDAAS